MECCVCDLQESPTTIALSDYYKQSKFHVTLL